LGGATACKKGGAPEGNTPPDSATASLPTANAEMLQSVRTLAVEQTLNLTLQNIEGQCQPVSEPLRQLLNLPAIAAEAQGQIKYFTVGQWQLPSQLPAVLYGVYSNAGGGYLELFVSSPRPNGGWAAMRLGDVTVESHTRREIEVNITARGRLNVAQRVFKAENPEGPFIEQEDEESGYAYDNGEWKLVAG